jgi:hypothetical protein
LFEGESDGFPHIVFILYDEYLAHYHLHPRLV